MSIVLDNRRTGWEYCYKAARDSSEGIIIDILNTLGWTQCISAPEKDDHGKTIYTQYSYKMEAVVMNTLIRATAKVVPQGVLRFLQRVIVD